MLFSAKGESRIYIPPKTVLMSDDRPRRYYEWLKKGKERLPHFTRPKDGTKLMLLAGLWDCVTLEGQHLGSICTERSR